MGLVPKFRKRKRCRRKLEKKNMRLKPEMTDYLCFSTRWIPRLPRYLLTFGFHWTHPSVRSPWYMYQWHIVLLIWHRCKHYFDSEYTSNQQGLLICTSTFFSPCASCEEVQYANYLWNGIQCTCNLTSNHIAITCTVKPRLSGLGGTCSCSVFINENLFVVSKKLKHTSLL